jgi:predicted kinase
MPQPTLYVMVGVPGSGKSTWIDAQDWTKNCVVVSTDSFVESYARSVGKTYTEVFEEYMPTSVKLMTEQVKSAVAENKDIVWDQTSTTVASRVKKFVMTPGYRKIAVVFPTPDRDELKRRLECRSGKVIPERVITMMIDGWQDPTLDEGFDEIWIGT